MALEAGTKLGHYEVVSSLGAGGMGEVYRARDTKLGREVAIKLLLEEVSQDAERLARFDREARVLASLNHPNIATLYGFESEGETSFLVMELVEGETLADRIKRGAIPVEDAIPLFIQIAEGLEAAHENGVIHRDLKPANIKVTDDGRVKILDFGLAKAMAPAGVSESEPSESPTITAAGYDRTRQGQILGTAAYMSPEQAKGKEVDRRADIWAFGACLYEALTGRRAFQANDAADTLAAVLRAELEWDALPPATPPTVVRLLRRCVARDVRDRLRDIGDARILLEDSLDAEAESAREVLPRGRKSSSGFLWGAVAAALLAGLSAGYLASGRAIVGGRTSGADVSVPGGTRQPLAWPRGLQMRHGPFAALSPDGSSFVYAGESQLYAWRFGELEPVAIPGTEGGRRPFLSPDGSSAAFFAHGELRRVDLERGIPETICEVVSMMPGVWLPDDTILYGTEGSGGLWQVPATGGSPEPFSTLERGEADHDYPHPLPGGDAIAYTVAPFSGLWDDSRIVVQSRSTGERRTLVEDAFYSSYTPTGHLLFAREGVLFAVRLDPDTLALQGSPKPVLDQMVQSPFGVGIAHYSFALDGSLLYVRGELQPPRMTPVWVDRTGVETPSLLPAARYGSPSLSSDGKRLLTEVFDSEDAGLWIFNVQDGGASHLTFRSFPYSAPMWSSDDSFVYYRSNVDGQPVVLSKRADGSGREREVVRNFLTPTFVSEDGSTVVGFTTGEDKSFDIVAVDTITGDEKVLVGGPGGERRPAVSPDGQWLAYESDESGTFEIYVRPYPDLGGGKWQVSLEGGTGALWGPDANELFFRNGGRVLSVSVDTSSRFRHGSPTRLFEGPYANSSGGPLPYDVSPDGDRFLMFKEAPDSSGRQLVLVRNWFEELKRLVPTE